MIRVGGGTIEEIPKVNIGFVNVDLCICIKQRVRLKENIII